VAVKLHKNNTLLWIGEQKNPIKTDRSSDLVMDSVINYYKSEKPRLPYKVGKLFLDNGAFTARMQGIVLDIERVIFVQESLRPHQTIPLDYPYRPGMSVLQMIKLWEKTKQNILYWQESTNLNGKLVMPIHAWSKKALINNVKWLQKKADAKFVALGSIVNPNFTNFAGFFGDRQPNKELIDMLAFAISTIQKNSDFKVHLMGFGSSPLMLHLAYYMGANSTDSSGYRRKAAYGKILLPGTGERYAGITSANFGVTLLSKSDLALLERCSCPVCRTNKYQLWSDWRARAIHNEYVMKQEVKKAQRFLSLGIEVYEKYLDNVVFSKSSLKYLWEYAKLRKKYYRISEILFEEEGV